MDLGAALVLGVVQGLTEFLPVSSSGHLVLSRVLLPEGALATPGVLFEAAVHLGTLAAALLYLRGEVFRLLRSLAPAPAEGREAARAGRRLLSLLLVASVPAGIAGVALAGPLRVAFEGTAFAAGGLVLTGTVLLGFRNPRARAPATETPLPAPPRGVLDALFIGVAQAIAILPGVSRSALTIIAGRERGLSPGDAARFSFLLSAPAIAGAALLEGAGAVASRELLFELAAGFLAAFGAGTLALRWVFDWLARRRFHQFGWYCLALGGIGLGLSSA